MQHFYLLSRSLDPLLGVFTGFLAFHLAEGNPRTAPPEGEKLSELVQWKYQKWKSSRQSPDEDVNSAEWEELSKAVKDVKS